MNLILKEEVDEFSNLNEEEQEELLKTRNYLFITRIRIDVKVSLFTPLWITINFTGGFTPEKEARFFFL